MSGANSRLGGELNPSYFDNRLSLNGTTLQALSDDWFSVTEWDTITDPNGWMIGEEFEDDWYGTIPANTAFTLPPGVYNWFSWGKFAHDTDGVRWMWLDYLGNGYLQWGTYLQTGSGSPLPHAACYHGAAYDYFYFNSWCVIENGVDSGPEAGPLNAGDGQVAFFLDTAILSVGNALNLSTRNLEIIKVA